jgi:mono/diheme cytochrome c family protein
MPGARPGNRGPRARRVAVRRTAAGLLCAGMLGACGGQAETAAARGERIYRANCVICHGLDPQRDGTLGPAIAGASRPLLEARVLRAEYPPGYTPKRDSRVMPALPFLAPEIPFLEAFLGGADPAQTGPSAD